MTRAELERFKQVQAMLAARRDEARKPAECACTPWITLPFDPSATVGTVEPSEVTNG